MSGELGKQVEKLAADFNASQSEYRIVPSLQGQLHRDGDGGDLRVPFAQPARHRPGQRDRHRHHDGGEGRDLSGVRIDARPVGAVFAGRLSAGRDRLLRRRRRQHAVVPVQRLDADPLLQQGPVPRRRARSGGRAEDLARGRRCGQAAARGGRRPAASPRPGRPGSMSRIFPPFTTCRSRPRPTASAASMRSLSSTIRWWCATSRSWRNGRPPRCSTTAAADNRPSRAFRRASAASSSARRGRAPTSRPIRNSRSATA